MIGKDFLFCDKQLSDFHMIMADSGEEDNSGLTREILKGSTTKNKVEANHYGAKYTDVLILNFLIVKDECALDNKLEKSNIISRNEYRRINAWLTSNQTPKSLRVISKNDTTTEYCGIFTDISPFVYRGVNGIKMTFTCNSPFAYKLQSMFIDNNSFDNSKVQNFYNDTDENDYVYPLIFIQPRESGTITISNLTENKTMQLQLKNTYKEYIIDCKLNRIIADGNVLSLADVGWNIQSVIDYNNINTGMFTAYWLRFLPRENKISFTGNAKFEVNIKIPVKIGGYVNV